MTADFSVISEIVKHRYDTGDYGDAHFRVTPTIWDHVREQMPARPTLGYADLDPLGDLLGIPIVVDEELPPGTWRLVRTSSGEELRAGVIGEPS